MSVGGPVAGIEYVYKVCSRAAWQAALKSGRLTPSADDRRDGFVHLSTRFQVAGTLARHFAGQADLLLLAVPVARLPAEQLRWEKSRDARLFPHLYSALRVEHVERISELPVESESHRLPPAFRRTKP